MGITYHHHEPRPFFCIGVRVDGKRTGDILRERGGGYYYRTKGGHSGERFATIEEVKRSLEGAD